MILLMRCDLAVVLRPFDSEEKKGKRRRKWHKKPKEYVPSTGIEPVTFRYQ